MARKIETLAIKDMMLIEALRKLGYNGAGFAVRGDFEPHKEDAVRWLYGMFDLRVDTQRKRTGQYSWTVSRENLVSDKRDGFLRSILDIGEDRYKTRQEACEAGIWHAVWMLDSERESGPSYDDAFADMDEYEI